ncbi:MAG: ThuA domain-containing protein [Clostridia bacterium]
MKKRALVVWGGWMGHEPDKVADIFKDILLEQGFETEVSDTLDSLDDFEKVNALHLLVPVWTMGEITGSQMENISRAVANGTGIAGCHGGMCDSFRSNTEWQFLTGGQWVSHPGGDQVEYMVNIRNSSSPITDGLKDFKVTSEQYYVHVDPCIEVLASTRFPTVHWYHSSNREVDVPVVWTKRWGHGRVFYSSLGHVADVFRSEEPLRLMRRGFLWVSEGKDIALSRNLSGDDFKNNAKMF